MNQPGPEPDLDIFESVKRTFHESRFKFKSVIHKSQTGVNQKLVNGATFEKSEKVICLNL